MTRSFVGIGFLAMTGLVGCSQPPNPVIARDPIPPPPAGYTVLCRSHPVILNGYFSHCAPAAPAIERGQAVIRAKG